jgi:hypothetical protein
MNQEDSNDFADLFHDQPAVEAYLQASQHEGQGDVYQAMNEYRRGK